MSRSNDQRSDPWAVARGVQPSPAAQLLRSALDDPRRLLDKLVIGEAIAERPAVLRKGNKKG